MKDIQAFSKYRELFSYLIVGGMTTLISWGVFALLTNRLGPVMANPISIVVAVTFAFVANKAWVFRSKSWKKSVVFPELIKFLAGRAVTAILELIGVPVLMACGMNQTIFGKEGMLAKVLITVVVIVLNYVFSKKLVFKDENH